jgi:hypothetical protein
MGSFTFYILPKFNALASSQTNNLLNGKRANFKGTLLLEREVEQDLDPGKPLPTLPNPPFRPHGTLHRTPRSSL